uniref:extracellular solute-binding protein n=1 Tax=Streptomyces griseiscabiei TaxID=2993540 RepID=UPI0011808E68
MKLAARLLAPVAALTLAGLTACAPQTSDNSASGEDEKTGTLRVWLFQEVSNEPKQKVVDTVVSAFEKAHDGAKVKIEYIPVETRAQRIKAAFNDPKSAPDLIEYGNTDTAGYVKDGGLADVTADFNAWSESKDSDPTAKTSVTVDGKIYGAPFFVGVRALYYRTDVFEELGLEVPKTLDELTATAKQIRAAKPDLYGLAVGGAVDRGGVRAALALGYLAAVGPDERHGAVGVGAADGEA